MASPADESKVAGQGDADRSMTLAREHLGRPAGDDAIPVLL
jgi:hypothetical protein